MLSIIPGLGQWYKGHPGRALLWFAFVLLFLSSAWRIGLLLWMICVINAGLAGAIREDVIAKSTRVNKQWLKRGGSLQMPMRPPGV